jgi:hypothetical protein
MKKILRSTWNFSKYLNFRKNKKDLSTEKTVEKQQKIDWNCYFSI